MKIFLKLLYVLAFLGVSNFSFGDEYPQIWNVPSHNRSFTGRNEVLDGLTQALSTSNDSILAIVGPPGIGKTQVAKRYAELSKHKYDIVWWMDGDNNIIEQYKALATAINQADNTKNKLPIYASEAILVEQLKNYLRRTNNHWLLIFDNSPNESSIAQYIPTKHNKSRGNILITSKSSTTWENMMKLEKFNKDESMAYFKRSFRAYKLSDDKALEKLADLLDNYPLALSQAIAYMNNTGISVTEYTTLFETQRMALWEKEKEFKDEHNNLAEFDHYKASIFTALALSINEIKLKSPKAFDLLVLCSFLDNEKIPANLLSFISKEDQQDQLSLNHYLTQLSHYSLLKRNHTSKEKQLEKTYAMHRLIQIAVLDLLNENEQKSYLAKLQHIMAKYLPDQIESLAPLIEENPSLAVHIKKINSHATKLEQINEDNLTILVRLLEYYILVPLDYNAAQAVIGDITDKTKTTKMNDLLLAQFYHIKSIYSSWYLCDKNLAIMEAKQALQLLESFPGRKEDLLNIHLQLAQSHIYKCDIDGAAPHIIAAEQIINNGSEKSIKTGLFYGVKSLYQMNQGDFVPALQGIRMAVEFEQSLNFSEDSPGEMAFYILEAEILLKQGKYQEALDKTKIMLTTVQNFYKDEEHELSSRIMIILAGAATRQGDVKLAKVNITKAIKILDTSYTQVKASAPDVDMANALIVLGDVQAYEKDYLGANKSYLKAEEIFKTLFSDAKTDDVSYLYLRLAINGANLNDNYQAEYYQKMHKDKFGEMHPRSNEILELLVKKQ
ncbi:MAG: NB-ARC domain-containing protein [Pseudomonadota bacterium]